MKIGKTIIKATICFLLFISAAHNANGGQVIKGTQVSSREYKLNVKSVVALLTIDLIQEIGSGNTLATMLTTNNATKLAYILRASISIKNLSKNRTIFHLKDFSLEFSQGKLEPFAYVDSGYENDTPTGTKRDIEFNLSPGVEKLFVIYFPAYRESPTFLLHFRDLNALEIKRPEIPKDKEITKP
jgi:hypothetical protein